MLTIENLQIGYAKRTLLRQLDLTAHKNEILAVLGPNGAGKTSFMKTIACLQTPRHGSIYLDKTSIRNLTPSQRARHIAYLPQHTPSSVITVFEAILLGRMPYLRFRASCLDISFVEDILIRLDIEHLAQRSCHSLSGGELQKVLIGRALAQDPQVLLLDEPVNHLDLANQIEVLHLLLELTQDKGLITLVVLHDLNLALRFAKRYLLLDGLGSYRSGAMQTILPEEITQIYRLPVVSGKIAGHTLFVPA